jgi:hypothetical protein
MLRFRRRPFDADPEAVLGAVNRGVEFHVHRGDDPVKRAGDVYSRLIQALGDLLAHRLDRTGYDRDRIARGSPFGSIRTEGLGVSQPAP